MLFETVKNKQEDLNFEVVDTYIADCLNESKQTSVRSIKSHFNKIVEAVRKAEKAALAGLDNAIKGKKEELRN